MANQSVNRSLANHHTSSHDSNKYLDRSSSFLPTESNLIRTAATFLFHLLLSEKTIKPFCYSTGNNSSLSYSRGPSSSLEITKKSLRPFSRSQVTSKGTHYRSPLRSSKGLSTFCTQFLLVNQGPLPLQASENLPTALLSGPRYKEVIQTFFSTDKQGESLLSSFEIFLKACLDFQRPLLSQRPENIKQRPSSEVTFRQLITLFRQNIHINTQ